MHKWLIGSDPELFLSNTDGTFFSAYGGPVKGTKAKPEETAYGAIQVDGMALELNTIPTEDLDEFDGFIEAGLDDVRKRFPDQRISDRAYFPIPRTFLDAQPKAATAFGCEPAYSSQWKKAIGMSSLAEADNGRAAGGHIHIGWCTGVIPTSIQHISQCATAVKALDFTVGAWVCQQQPAAARAKRHIWTPAGSFRPKSYGLEYRTLDNGWLFDAKLRREILQRTVATMDMLADGVDIGGLCLRGRNMFITSNTNSAHDYFHEQWRKSPIPAKLEQYKEKRYGTTG